MKYYWKYFTLAQVIFWTATGLVAVHEKMPVRITEQEYGWWPAIGSFVITVTIANSAYQWGKESSNTPEISDGKPFAASNG